MATAQRVRAQYERYPYPPVSIWALPRAAQAGSVAFERAAKLAEGCGDSTDIAECLHQGIRVLVAGGGTLEPLIVAQAHPQAHEVTVVDLSARSIERARRRLAWFRIQRWLMLRSVRSPPVTWVVNDLNCWPGGEFDYIIASNVLHHTPDPAGLFARFATWLRPGGVLRVVTYPKLSRLWLREVGRWLQWHGLNQSTPHLKQKARQVIAELPVEHPIRLCFENHRESSTSSGIVDAFLHAWERPLSPCEWGRAAAQAGLVLVGEDQHMLSRSTFLDELVPPCRGLEVWSKLEVLDCTLELSTNPVLWFVKPSTTPQSGEPRQSTCLAEETRFPASSEERRDDPWLLTPALSPTQVWAQRPTRVRVPSHLYWELGEGVRRAARILAQAGVDIAQLMDILRAEVGTHLSADGIRPLPGFAASDYDTATLLSALAPWRELEWNTLDELAAGVCSVKLYGHALPAGSLWKQAQWLQSRYGTLKPVVELELDWQSSSST